MKRKCLKILIILTASALLLFPFSVSAASSGSLTYTGAFVGNNLLSDDYDNLYVVSGSYNNSTFKTYTSSTSGNCEFDFLSGPTSLVPGDIFNLSGIIAVPNGIASIQISAFGLSSTNVTYKESFSANWGVGGSDWTFRLYEFNINFTNTTSSNISNFYNNSNIRIIVNRSNSNYNNSLAVVRLQYSLNNNPSVSLNNQANQIISGTQSAVNGQTNETYGYSKPSSNNTDSGLASGGNLIDSLNTHIDSFNSSLNANVNNVLDNITDFKTMVSSVYDILPQLLQYLIVFGLIFLIMRKVVGR